MTDDRVANLESRVRELEATLNGLTDELVDTKDRLETVEEAVAEDEPSNRRTDIVEGELLGEGQDGGSTASEGDGDAAHESDTDTGAETGAETDTEAADAEEADGIIVA